MKNILFICTGNTCRSPLAEYLLRYKGGELFQAQSAGISAYPGDPVAGHVQDLLFEQGIPINHTSRRVNPELMEWADLVLTMTQTHQRSLIAFFPEQKEKIFTLKEYVQPDGVQPNISDPFGGELEVYRATMEELDLILAQLIEKEKLEKRED